MRGVVGGVEGVVTASDSDSGGREDDMREFYYPAPANSRVLDFAVMNGKSQTAPVRAIGWVGLTAIAINSMVGAGIFVLPANVAQLLGPASLLGYVIAGAAVLLVVACFAEVGSAFEKSGGPYIYAREALGPYLGFQAGWMLVLSRVAGGAAIANTFAAYLSYLWPAVAKGIGHASAITLMMAMLTWVNYRGVRPGVWLMQALTIGKLVPLLVFCGVGLFFIDTSQFSFTAIPAAGSIQQATLLLMFAFGGFEYASVPSEEVIDPRRALPRALLSAVVAVVVLYLLIQFVAMGTLPGLAASATPLTSAARSFMGSAGEILLTVGAILSTSGTNSAAIFVGPRTLYSMAAAGQLPAWLGKLHPQYQTPGTATILFSLVTWLFAVTGSFTLLATVAALARVFYYTTTCLAVPILRRKMPRARRFTLPGGLTIPVLALAVCVWLFAGSTLQQASATGGAFVLGTVAYLLMRKFRAI